MLTQVPRIFPENRSVLGAPRIVSLIVPVRDLTESREFYGKVLGLPLVVDDGRSVRYDAGGVILDLRQTGEDGSDGSRAGVTPVFCVEDLGDTVWQLAKRGIHLAPTVCYSRAGGTARLQAPSGPLYWIWEPSDEARDGPGGRKLEEILSAHH